MSCTDVQTIQAGNGTKTQFSFDFPYIFKSEIHVYFWNATTKEWDEKLTTDGTHPWRITDANPTIVEFTSTAPPSPTTPTDPGETTVDNVKIRRITNLADIRALFNPGSAIRSDDLNNNFEQLRYAIQESNCPGVTEEVYQYLLDNYWDRFDNTLYSADTWRSDDATIATTAALDQRFQDEVNDTLTKAELAAASDVMPDNDDAVPTTGATKDYIDHVIETDILVDGTGLNKTGSGGQVTIGISAGSVDLDRIKADDIITFAEQPSVATSDNNIFTARAAERQFDTIVQTTTPTGSDWEVGKTWLQNDEDKTVRIWNGSAWVAVASGGAFTELSKVVYVDAVNGDDSLAGHRISNPKRTIKAAMDQINAETDAVGNGSLVIVAPGIYAEEFPITIQKNDVSIVGTSLRNCIIHPAIGVTAATAAVNGSEYRIRFVGTTDFTAIGAADNNVGTVFTATGAGTGTGTLEDTAVQAAYDVDVPEANELSTMFQVNSGTYIQNLTLQGMKGDGTRGGNTLDTDATFGLPTDQGWNFAFFPGATIRKSPYIQNCTNFSDSQINNVNFTPHVPGEGAAGDLDSGGFSGGGILIDGDTVAANSPLRSMVCDSYTHTALNGPGIFVTNNGYTQVTSSYAFFTHYHLKCLNGGQANLAASTSDFGRYSLIADGQSSTNIFTSNVDGAAADGDTTFNINEPVADASWHGNANRPQPNMLVTVNGVTYPILSATARTDTEGGDGWTVTISRPDPANRSNNLGLNGAIADDDVVQFFLRSQIASSGHTMEYVGSGTDYRALPENATGTFPVGANDPVTADATAGNAPCGVPSEERQTIVLNNGAIWTAVTDHNGKFRVGGDQVNDPTYEVDQQLGRVTFRTGSLSIPTLIENLDTNGFNIFDSTGHVNINDELDVNSNKIVNVTDPTAAQDAATKNYVDTTTTANPIYVAAAGDTMSGELAMGSNKITGLGTPTANTDAATKLYVDSQVSVADKIEEGNSSVEVVDTGSNGTITFTNDGSESARIDSSRRLLLGINSATTGTNSANSLLQVVGGSSSQTQATINLCRNENSADISLNELIGEIYFGDRQAGEYAKIKVNCDGTAAGVGDYPGRIEFHTTADGASSPTERMRIDSSGRVLIGQTDTTGVDGEADNLVVSSTGHTGITVRSGSSHNASVYFADQDAVRQGRIEYNHTSDYMRFNTAGTEVLRINSSGSCGIGTTSPVQRLHVAGAVRFSNETNTNLELLSNSTSGSNRIWFGDPDATTQGSIQYLHSDNALVFQVNGLNQERARIDNSGRLLVGTSTSTNNIRLNQKFSVVTEGLHGGASLVAYGGTQADSAPHLDIKRSRGSTDGTMTSVANGDLLGSFQFLGADGTNFVRSAQIDGQVDGTPGSNDMPGRLVFSTTADGATTPTERFRMGSAGQLGIGGANYGTSGQVLTSQGNAAAPQWATPAEGFVDYGGTFINGTSTLNVTGISLDCRLLKIYVMHVSCLFGASPQISLRLGNGSVSSQSYTGRVFETDTNTQQATGSNQINITHTGHTSNTHTWTGIIDVGMSVSSGCAVSWNIFTDVNHCEFGAARWNGNNRIDRIQLFSAAGNWDGGYIRIFGDR